MNNNYNLKEKQNILKEYLFTKKSYYYILNKYKISSNELNDLLNQRWNIK